jgi:hypothetical protein
VRNPAQPRPREVARLLLPAFAASTLVILVGILLIVEHHRSLGFVLVMVGLLGGFGVRAWLMLRDQRRRQLLVDPPEPPR